jgi:hypothetical protein
VNSLTGLALLISVEVTRENLGPKGFIGGHSRTGDAGGTSASREFIRGKSITWMSNDLTFGTRRGELQTGLFLYLFLPQT